MHEKSEVCDENKIRSDKASEIIDHAEQNESDEDGKSVKGCKKTSQKTTSKKRLGTSGPILYPAKKIKQEPNVEAPVLLEIITMDKLESPIEEKFEKNGKKYIKKCVLKMGCNKCTEVFYSDDGYKHHLYKTHRIKNINKYPPMIINRVSQILKDMFVKLKIEHGFNCPSCDAVFNTDKGLEQHANTCYKRSVEEKEESAKYLYESLEEGGFDPISDDNEYKDDIKKEKPSTSRKRKRGKTSFTPKKRKATSSISKSSPKKKAKTFSKKTPEAKFGEEGDDSKGVEGDDSKDVEGNDSKDVEGDESKGVEFYQKVLDKHKTKNQKKINSSTERDDSKDEDYKLESNEDTLNAEEEEEEEEFCIGQIHSIEQTIQT